MTNVIFLAPSNRYEKKYMVRVADKTIHFGARGYEDYTMHKDRQRYLNYINRHKARENWTKSGIDTAGFWSRWLLWNLPSFQASLRDIERRFNVKIRTK